MPNIWEIENVNKLVFTIDKNYRELLYSLCVVAILNYPGIPLEPQDLYYEFLGEVARICREYQTQLHVPFRNYLSLRCKYFCANRCKYFTSHNFQILNNYVAFEEKYCGIEDVKLENNENLLGLLTVAELEYFRLHFLEGKKDVAIQKEMNLSRYKVKSLHEQIMKKMKTKFKI